MFCSLLLWRLLKKMTGNVTGRWKDWYYNSHSSHIFSVNMRVQDCAMSDISWSLTGFLAGVGGGRLGFNSLPFYKKKWSWQCCYIIAQPPVVAVFGWWTGNTLACVQLVPWQQKNKRNKHGCLNIINALTLTLCCVGDKTNAEHHFLLFSGQREGNRKPSNHHRTQQIHSELQTFCWDKASDIVEWHWYETWWRQRGRVVSCRGYTALWTVHRRSCLSLSILGSMSDYWGVMVILAPGCPLLFPQRQPHVSHSDGAMKWLIFSLSLLLFPQLPMKSRAFLHPSTVGLEIVICWWQKGNPVGMTTLLPNLDITIWSLCNDCYRERGHQGY